ncbi:MAG: hypothetical protein N3E52_04440 [Candidatus Bathyarchaeota archaeon]|nr:hypothetical protein [Candidatus Bathyarchaeota archaeon]
MNVQHNTNQITAINGQIDSLRAELNKVNITLREHIARRDKLNEKFRACRLEIQTLRTERDQLNALVKSLKQQRDSAREQKKTVIQEIKDVSEKLAKLKVNKPKKSRQQIEKEIHDIEWKIQTSPLDLKDEKKLVDEARQLEQQLNIYQKIEQLNAKIASLKRELEALEAKANASHQELVASAQRSQELHSIIIIKIKEADEIKKEADLVHSAFVQAKESLQPLQQKLKALLEQRRQLQNSIKRENELNKKIVEKTLKSKLEAQVRSRLQSGERLSWEEFQLLADDDSEEQGTQA